MVRMSSSLLIPQRASESLTSFLCSYYVVAFKWSNEDFLSKEGARQGTSRPESYEVGPIPLVVATMILSALVVRQEQRKRASRLLTGANA